MILVADPPWKTGTLPPKIGGGSHSKYKLMPTNEIMRFPLPPIPDDAILFLWRLSCMVPDAYAVVSAWGFVAKTELVWLKKTRKGNRWFGLGLLVRAEHETCIIAARGKYRSLLLQKNIRSTFEAPVGEHSQKPEEFYRLVESLTAGPYHELFARRRRDGWICEGDEL